MLPRRATLVPALATLCLTGCTTGGNSAGTSPPPQKATTLTLTSSTPVVAVNTPLTLAATLAPAVVGDIVVTDPLAWPDDNNPPLIASGSFTTGLGRASLAVTPTDIGTHRYVAAFEGNAPGGWEPSSAAIDIGVSAPPGPKSCGLGTAVFLLTSGQSTETGQSYNSTASNESAVCAQNAGTVLTLNQPAITRSGISFGDPADPAGLGAAVLATDSTTAGSGGAGITVNGGSITVPEASSAAFASGTGAEVDLNNVAITATQTAGVAASRGGKIAVSGGSIATQDGSPALILGEGSISFQNAALSTTPSPAFANDTGIWLINPAAATTDEATGSFTMTGGSYTTQADPAFLTGEAASITLTSVQLSTGPDILINEGSAPVTFTANNETFAGAFKVQNSGDGLISLVLRNHSAFTGTNAFGNISLDATSTWIVPASGTQTIETLDDPEGISGSSITNIVGNGNNVSYDPAANPALDGKTFALVNGGQLIPASS